ncbi:hypothetical protein ACJJTC_011940 [Scirpophaga incertulas]
MLRSHRNAAPTHRPPATLVRGGVTAALHPGGFTQHCNFFPPIDFETVEVNIVILNLEHNPAGCLVSVCVSPAGSVDLGVVAAISFGLTYFYWEKKQNDERRREILQRRRCWMIKATFLATLKIHSSRKGERD